MDKSNTAANKYHLKLSVLGWYFCLGYLLFTIGCWFSSVPISVFVILFGGLIVGGLFFAIQFYLGKVIFGESWWYSKFPLASISCDCPTCTNWRKEKRKTIFISVPILIIYLCLLALVVFTLPYIPLDYGVSKRVSKQELKIKIKQIEFSLNSTVETDYFAIKRLPTNELVKDKIGKYYLIDLQSPKFGQKILFEAGRYTINSTQDKFVNCLNVFVDSVYSYLNCGYQAEIFVKGSADFLGQDNFQSDLNPKYSYNEGFTQFPYLPQVDESLWLSKPKFYEVSKVYNNSDLPNLRGRFIQYTFEKAFQDLPKPEILEGSVERKISAGLRNAYLILYYNPKKPKI